MVYALYPQCNLWIYVNPMEDKERVEITMGKSILDRSSTVNVGSLMLKYGGGHQAVETCSVSRDESIVSCRSSSYISVKPKNKWFPRH